MATASGTAKVRRRRGAAGVDALTHEERDRLMLRIVEEFGPERGSEIVAALGLGYGDGSETRRVFDGMSVAEIAAESVEYVRTHPELVEGVPVLRPDD